MANKRTSKVWTTSKEELQELINNSNALIDVVEKLGYSRNSSGTYRALKKRIAEDCLDTSILENKRAETYRGNSGKRRKTPLEEILVENSPYENRTRLKIRLLSEGYLKNECSECGLPPVWNGKELVMVLDHINGINNDNRIKNLRLLCPNCNSQMETFAGRNCK